MWCIPQRMCLHWTNTPRSKPVRYLWNSSINLITEWFSVWVTRNSFLKNHCLISKIDFCSCWTFLTDLLLHCTGLTAWTDTQTLLFLVPYSNCALYRMNISSWVYLVHQHNRACVSICLAVFISTAFQRRGGPSSVLLMDLQGEVMRAGNYLGPADDACGVFVSLYVHVKLSVWKLQCVFVCFVHWLWSNAGSVFLPQSRTSRKASSHWEEHKHWVSAEKPNWNFLSWSQ